MKKKNILICSNYAWTIYNFRLQLINRLNQEGYNITILTQFDGYEEKFRKNVHRVSPLYISRKGINPFIDFLTLANFIKNFLSSKPDLVLLFSIKPVIYGSLATRILKIKTIPTITGLGTVFIKNSFITKIVKVLYRIALRNVQNVFFQNQEDRHIFLESKLVSNNIALISPGSGVDTKAFPYKPLNEGQNFKFLLIARLIWDKGILEFVNAAKMLKIKFPNTSFQLLGPLKVQNRTSIPYETFHKWLEEGYIEYLGETNDVQKYIEKSDCIVLPSYREGLSRTLLEAASMGRPLIASNVAGCREVVEDGINGYLCNPRDETDLYQKMEKMIKTPFYIRKIMGEEGRKKVVKSYNQEVVNNLYIDRIQNSLLN